MHWATDDVVEGVRALPPLEGRCSVLLKMYVSTLIDVKPTRLQSSRK
jgi:hypothetical protein